MFFNNLREADPTKVDKDTTEYKITTKLEPLYKIQWLTPLTRLNRHPRRRSRHSPAIRGTALQIFGPSYWLQRQHICHLL